jgi:hypothetical protein
MDDANRRRITETLQREADRIAEVGASEARARIISQVSNGSLRSQAAGIGDRAVGRQRSPHQQAGTRDSRSPLPDLLKEGLAQMGGALSLGVLVDEPGLLADDLHWLRRMLGARGMQLDPPVIDLLLRSYLDACSSFLDAEEIEALDDLIARAKGRLT